MNQKIVIVDDEKEIADLLAVYLKNDGFDTICFNDSQQALVYLLENEIDLAILDVMLPVIDGFELVKKIREKYYYPILMLTAKIEDIDKITGLSLGADDYITKPFNPLEVVARVKTQLRRVLKYNTSRNEDINLNSNIIDIRGLYINKETHVVELYGENLELTPIEFSILWYLGINKGKVISSEELFEKVWKEKYLDNNNTVMAHIARLREKMNEVPRKPKFVKTVWGVGYKIDE